MSDDSYNRARLIEARTVFSIVSHGQLDLVANLLRDFAARELTRARIIVTLNVPEDEDVLRTFTHLNLTVIRNSKPKGFGENHNQAFEMVDCDFFVVVNPDIRLRNVDLKTLLAPFSVGDVGAVAPVVVSPVGTVEDSARRFPTVSRLLKRVLFGDRKSDYHWTFESIPIDWAAGMFVAFRADAFREIGGFDVRYFLYMEDADICRRLGIAAWKTVLQPASVVIHDAQRQSRRDFRYLKWHLASAFRFLFLPVGKIR